jgi:hypothetical protein
MRGCAACLVGTNKVRPRGERKSPRNIIGYLSFPLNQPVRPEPKNHFSSLAYFERLTHVEVFGELVTWYQVLVTGHLLFDTAMFYKRGSSPCLSQSLRAPLRHPQGVRTRGNKTCRSLGSCRRFALVRSLIYFWILCEEYLILVVLLQFLNLFLNPTSLLLVLSRENTIAVNLRNFMSRGSL